MIAMNADERSTLAVLGAFLLKKVVDLPNGHVQLETGLRLTPREKEVLAKLRAEA